MTESQGSAAGNGASEFRRHPDKMPMREASRKPAALSKGAGPSVVRDPLGWELPGEEKKILRVNMEALRKELPSEWMIVGKYYTTHTFSSTALFNHLRDTWHPRGGHGVQGAC